jgi:hypothetical protein
MTKPRLEEMRIRPAKNGGHNVQHTYIAKPRFSKGAMTGGMTIDRPQPEEFNFGPKDGASLMKHIAGTLALKGLAGAGGGAKDGEEEMPAE